MKVKAEVFTSTAHLRQARSEAIANSMPTGVKFDKVNRQIYIFSDINDEGFFSNSLDSVNAGPFAFTRQTIIRSSSFPQNTVVFDINGSANNTGCIESTWDENVAEGFPISVLASTGRIKMGGQCDEFQYPSGGPDGDDDDDD